MITKEELQELLSSTETYRVERTVSTTDKDKFGEAVCAFANDMPDSGKPGYLLIGAYSDGRLSGLKATDELLQKFAALRSDGNILPIPAIAVESFSFPEGDVIAVEVQPSDQPPVRYRGRTWIRIGPRRDIASPAEETILAERKARNFTTFDARPCFGASLDDIDLDLFQHDYLPKAVDAAILASDDRPIERKLESLRLFNSVYNLPTNAAVMLFGKNPLRFFPGAYVQYVEFDGEDKTGKIVNEKAFRESIVKTLPKLESFLEATASRKYPVKVSAMREETLVTYPNWAIRELVMNAIMHRDYQGNAPVRVYQFTNWIEILNHGALYGRARPENFPNINDYRNPVLAEAMRVLGYVNAYNLGIAEVQKRLAANGNAPAEFDFSLITAFRVVVRKASEDAIKMRVGSGKRLVHNKKCAIEPKKCAIEPVKCAISPQKCAIDELLEQAGCSRPRCESIRAIHREFCDGREFGRHEIDRILSLDYSSVGRILAMMAEYGAIVRVKGHGKGRFVFAKRFVCNNALEDLQSRDTVSDTVNETGVEKSVEKSAEKIIRHLLSNPKATQKELAAFTGLSVRGVEKNLKNLKESGRIRRIGPAKGGHWEVVK